MQQVCYPRLGVLEERKLLVRISVESFDRLERLGKDDLGISSGEEEEV